MREKIYEYSCIYKTVSADSEKLKREIHGEPSGHSLKGLNTSRYLKGKQP